MHGEYKVMNINVSLELAMFRAVRQVTVYIYIPTTAPPCKWPKKAETCRTTTCLYIIVYNYTAVVWICDINITL
jgi:hypothetical protein